MDLRSRVASRAYAYAKGNRRIRGIALTAARKARRALLRGRRLASPGYAPPQVTGSDDSSLEWMDRTSVETRMVETRPTERVTNTAPKSLTGEYDERYRPLEADVPPAFFLEIEGARIVSDGVLVGLEGRVNHHVSKPIGSLRGYVEEYESRGPHVLEPYLAFPPRVLKGTALVLAAIAGRGYFHWIFDVIARLGVVSQAGLDLRSIDHFVVNNYSAGYHVETLNSLGIHRERVVTTFRNPHILAEHLIVPSLAREIGVIPSWACEFIRDAFPARGFSASLPDTRRIYISRAATDHGRLPDELRLLDRLRPLGFHPVLLETLTMEEKATLFSRAEAILGPSGAGLTNCVFSNPGTMLIDACSRGFASLEAWDISGRLGLEYWYVPAEQVETTDHVFGWSVPAEDILATLEAAGVD